MNPTPIALLALFLSSAQTSDKPVRAALDSGVVTTRQAVTPAGVQSVFYGRVHGIAFGETSSQLWVLTKGQGNNDTQISRLDWNANRLIESIPIKENPGLQGIQFDPVAGRATRLCDARGHSRPASRPRSSAYDRTRQGSHNSGF